MDAAGDDEVYEWRWLTPFYLPPTTGLTWAEAAILAAFTTAGFTERVEIRQAHPSELLRQNVLSAGVNVPVIYGCVAKNQDAILLTDGGLGAVVRTARGDGQELLRTSTSQDDISLDATQTGQRLASALGVKVDSREAVLPRGQALWWHRIVLDNPRLEVVESLIEPNCHVVTGTSIRVGHGYSSCSSAELVSVETGILLALEEWVAVHDINSMSTFLSAETWRRVRETNADVAALRPQIVSLSAEVAARSAAGVARRRVVPDLPLRVWDAARQNWRTSEDLDLAFARLRGLDDVARSAHEQQSAKSAARRNVLLLVITALSLLSLLPSLVDFATNPNDRVRETFRLVLASMIALTAFAALASTWWATRERGSR